MRFPSAKYKEKISKVRPGLDGLFAGYEYPAVSYGFSMLYERFQVCGPATQQFIKELAELGLVKDTSEKDLYYLPFSGRKGGKHA